MVKPFEKQAYGRFEASAFQATGLGGSSKNGARYISALKDMVVKQGDGLFNGTAMLQNRGIGARIDGRIPDIFGSGNARMALNVGLMVTPGAIGVKTGYLDSPLAGKFQNKDDDTMMTRMAKLTGYLFTLPLHTTT